MITDLNYKLYVSGTPAELNSAAAGLIVKLAGEAISAHGRFCIALSGGQTPLDLYSLLAESPYREQVVWEKVYIFWGDERCVDLTDKDNNASQATLHLLDKVPVPASNIFAIPVNLLPTEAAKQYWQTLVGFFGTTSPKFDLILLGLGENGHTASLFPFATVLQEQKPGIKEVYVEELHMFRITMTAPLINLSRNVIFLVNGVKKAGIVEDILNGPYCPEKYPAQLIKPVKGNLYWLLDREAASQNDSSKENDQNNSKTDSYEK